MSFRGEKLKPQGLQGLGHGVGVGLSAGVGLGVGVATASRVVGSVRSVGVTCSCTIWLVGVGTTCAELPAVNEMMPPKSKQAKTPTITTMPNLELKTYADADMLLVAVLVVSVA